MATKINNYSYTLIVLRHEVFFHIARHVQSQWERKVCVDFFFQHGQHVERVSHGVEAQNVRQLLEARPEFKKFIYASF